VKFPRRLVIILLVFSMTTYIFGCMEEEADDGTGGNGGDGNGGDDGGDVNVGVLEAMDVEITNIEYDWDGERKNPLDLPELVIRCEAINYGGPGWCMVVLVVNGTNSSIRMKRLIGLGSNEQKGLEFWGKIEEEPTNITSYVERELLEAITAPKSPEMDVETMNIFPEIVGWLDDEQTELEVIIYASVINYQTQGYITLVVEVEGVGFTKTVEERMYLDWYQFDDLQFDMVLPGPPVNTTITTKRPQPE